MLFQDAQVEYSMVPVHCLKKSLVQGKHTYTTNMRILVSLVFSSGHLRKCVSLPEELQAYKQNRRLSDVTKWVFYFYD